MEDLKKMKEKLESMDECTLNFKFVLAGKTGVGKSSVINAIIGSEVCAVAKDARPCTRKNEEFKWNTDIGNIKIVDVPGFGEANSPKIDGVDYMENIRVISRDAHILLLVLKCDDKALELEYKFYQLWIQDSELSKIPVIIVVNQIDKADPVREWEPDSMDLVNSKTKKEFFINSYIKYVADNFGKLSSEIIPVCAEEPKFGIDTLKNKINFITSDILELVIDRTEQSIDDRARRIIRNYSLSAATVALQPIPIVDSLLIAPLQVAMIIHLGHLYGVQIVKSLAVSILNSLGLSLTGNYIFLGLVSLLPGLKQVLGPAIAYSLTYTSGLIIQELLLTKNLQPTIKELKKLVKKYKEEAVKAKKEYEKEHANQ